jgi:hypothetical protein
MSGVVLHPECPFNKTALKKCFSMTVKISLKVKKFIPKARAS